MAEVRVKVQGRVVTITRRELEEEPGRVARRLGLLDGSAEFAEWVQATIDDLDLLDRLVGKPTAREESRVYVVDGWEL